jgi:group I intron endonuclease
MIVYKVINKINNKVYIGQTSKTLEVRIKSHIKEANNNSNLLLHKAIRKYGIDNFTWEVIRYCSNRKELNDVEITEIALHKSIENGYNITKGGVGMLGYKHTDKTKSKISKIGKGRKISNIGIQNMSNAKKKQWKDVEYKEKQIKAAKNRWSNKEEIEKQSIRRGSKYFIVIDENNKTIWKGLSQRLCSRELNLDCVAIGRCLKKIQQTHRGFKFYYCEA